MYASSKIGPYSVLRLLNHGGQGHIYLGYDNRLHRKVAIKLLELPEARNERNSLLNEAQVVASIHSGKVVQIHDLVISQDHVALIMEYVPGCNLEDYLEVAKPSPATVLAVATDLAGALTVARQQKIVHGDLKASNVLVTEMGRVKLTDFGIARAGLERAARGSSAGSPSCVSPEQFLGQPLDVRSDLFALGCLLYRMVTGFHPFFRGGELDVGLLLDGEPEPVEEFAQALPYGLSLLIHALLQKNPEDRPADTLQVRFALRDIARGIPLSVSSTLLEESLPVFREEAEGDIPPLIPEDLRKSGRSRLRPFRFDELWSWRSLTLKSGFFRTTGLVVSLLIGLIVGYVKLQPENTRVHIEMPDLRIAAEVVMPPGVSRAWMVDLVKEAASARIGPLFVSGPVGATPVRTLHAVPAGGETDERLSLALRCSVELCFFAMERQWGGRHSYGQAVLFPDNPTEQWARTIKQVARALYTD